MTTGSLDLAAAIIAALGDEALDALAHRLAPRLVQHINQAAGHAPDRWLDTRQAAEYAGCGVSTLQRAAAAGEVESCQDSEHGKRWFRSEWIDAWRMGARPPASDTHTGRDASKLLP